MEPVEINAGAWYLRGLRADDRISDASALRELGIPEPEDYVRQSDSAWTDEKSFTWAICEPTTGELVALIGVTTTDGTARLWDSARSGFDDAVVTARGPVCRFAVGALGLPMPTLLGGSSAPE